MNLMALGGIRCYDVAEAGFQVLQFEFQESWIPCMDQLFILPGKDEGLFQMIHSTFKLCSGYDHIGR